jgi:hypothetical protein
MKNNREAPALHRRSAPYGMSKNNMTDENRNTFRYFSWKNIFGFMLVPILMNVFFEINELFHFNTFDSFPLAELIDNILLYVGNWPSLLLKMYPYVIAGGGEVVYEVAGWISPITFIINLIGWGLLGFISSYAIRKSKSAVHQKHENS